MKIDHNLHKFLNGEVFSAAESFNFKHQFEEEKRVDFLERIVQGKKIIHLGCLDHVPLIEQKIKNNNWLHLRLTNNSERCLGFDINDQLENVKQQFNIDNIFHSDICSSVEPKIKNEQWDYLIVGEVLEHIDNPVDFLTKLRDNYKGSIKQIIITVPNAFDKSRMKLATQGIEYINTDHRFWFSPFTLMKVATMAGFTPKELDMKNRVSLSKIELIKRKMYSKVLNKTMTYPFHYFNTLVLISDF